MKTILKASLSAAFQRVSSTGEFCFPNQLAAEIAVQTVKDYLTEHPDSSIKQVVFNVFKDIDRDIYQRLL